MKAPCKKHISVGHRQLRFELQQSPQGCPTLTGFNCHRAEIKNRRSFNRPAMELMVENRGIEPLTSGLQSPRSPS